METKRGWEELQARERTRAELRDKVFEHILQSQKFMKENGLITTEEYLRWRLPFDRARYDLD